MQYYSCSMIENFFLNINGHIDNGAKSVALCCEALEGVPAVAFTGKPQEIIEQFIQLRTGVIEESKGIGVIKEDGKLQDAEHIFIAGCSKCANYQPGEWRSDGLIHYVNLSMYPAPCQSKCTYCGVHGGEGGKFNRVTAGEHYEKLFDMLEYARGIGLIAPNARWQVSSGEIAIHPYRDRIMDLVKGQTAIFYTNCFIFDETIAANLADNPHSAINLSIDAGLPQTWLKVKGVDNFEDVTDNLVKYFNNSCRPGQITLKYIVLPGVNDNYEDYSNVIEIMKILQVKHLTISRDTNLKYSGETEQLSNLIGAAAYLLAMLAQNGMTCDMFTFAPSEREQTIALAKELISSGEV